VIINYQDSSFCAVKLAVFFIERIAAKLVRQITVSCFVLLMISTFFLCHIFLVHRI
jgi:hypothetical protein